MIMDIDQAIKFGQMESRLDALEKSVDEVKKQSTRMEDKIDVLVKAVSSSAGGKSMLVLLLTLSAAFGGIITKIVEVFAR